MKRNQVFIALVSFFTFVAAKITDDLYGKTLLGSWAIEEVCNEEIFLATVVCPLFLNLVLLVNAQGEDEYSERDPVFEQEIYNRLKATTA